MDRSVTALASSRGKPRAVARVIADAAGVALIDAGTVDRPSRGLPWRTRNPRAGLRHRERTRSSVWTRERKPVRGQPCASIGAGSARRPRPSVQATATKAVAPRIEHSAPAAAAGGKCPRGIQHNIALPKMRAVVHRVLLVRAPRGSRRSGNRCYVSRPRPPLRTVMACASPCAARRSQRARA
jgi:hypothetical protein